MSTFKEFTFIYMPTYLEFMVDIDTETYKVIDCYTYGKDLKKDKQDNQYGEFEYSGLGKLKWRQGKNSLFVHNKNVFKTIARNCVVMPEDEQEWDFLHQAMTANGVTNFEILEP